MKNKSLEDSFRYIESALEKHSLEQKIFRFSRFLQSPNLEGLVSREASLIEPELHILRTGLESVDFDKQCQNHPQKVTAWTNQKLKILRNALEEKKIARREVQPISPSIRRIVIVL
ncbi:hypothetical protein [Ruegeria sp. HKCCA0235A]|uniref:hypothetical protein n=1 Tax=Ruegeria sp. HKCCA0235A TaxID=2682998 RepID=UPI00148953AF|nr:hypothetical protein [Ruegeria sp. HKCCA0235A]